MLNCQVESRLQQHQVAIDRRGRRFFVSPGVGVRQFRAKTFDVTALDARDGSFGPEMLDDAAEPLLIIGKAFFVRGLL